MKINSAYTCNITNYSKGRTREILYLVIHYVGASGSAFNNARYFMNTNYIKASAHYFVGHQSENGAIYQSVSDGDTAWHCGTTGAYVHPYCRNSNSIGIEMCTHKDNSGSWYFDEVTIENTIALVKELMAKYNIASDNVIRHYDVTGKICPAPFVEDESAWQAFKQRLLDNEEDDNMATVIKQIADKAGKTEAEVIEALAVLVKFANVKEDDWEKEGVEKLKDLGVINSEHDARELIGFGTFGLMLDRFKKIL